jgi:dienelactone hydrolase
MLPWLTIGHAIALVYLSAQVPPLLAVDEQVLREYAGAYQWDQTHVVYLQVWAEFSGSNQLVAFDDTGEIRVLFPTDRDRFFTGPGIRVSTALESTVDFQRDRAGQVTSLTWRREGGTTRTAKRATIERRDEVKFRSGGVQLAGTLIRSANANGKLPAIVLVPGAGAQDREYVLPFAHSLIPHGVAILGVDKRGVGASTGDWNKASSDDLAGDVVAAVEYLKTRRDIDPTQIGVLGWSQAGLVMPQAALRSKDIAFLIGVSCDPKPLLQTLQIPVLAIVGELDNDILAEKNQDAWLEAIKAGGAHDYTVRVIPKADRVQLEAKTGSKAEMNSLQHFAPAYVTTLQEWAASHLRGYRATP